jgi:hypothetical protein
MPLKNNSVIFDKIGFKKKVISAIKNGFENDENKPVGFWYNVFGKRKIKCYDSFIKDTSSFPCYYLVINAVPSTRHSHSTQINQFSRVLMEIYLKNVAVGDTDKETLGYVISNRIIQILQEEFGITLTNDTNLSNYNETIQSNVLRFVFIYDNINEIIYKGE